MVPGVMRYSHTLSTVEECVVQPNPAVPFPRNSPSRPCWALALIAAAVWADGAENPEGAIREWIGQLGSDQFAQREAATRHLTTAGAAAVEPLAEAAGGADLEVSSRAIDILRGLLDPRPGHPDGAENGDVGDADAGVTGGPVAPVVSNEVAAAAERVLERLAEGPPGPAAQLASTALEYHLLGMHEAALERLEALGAKVSDGIAAGRRGLLVVVGSDWKGGMEELRLLPRLRNLRNVAIHGVKIDPSGLAVLGRLRGLEALQLYGTGLSDDDVAALAARFPTIEIDVRKGGKLGVGGQRLVGPCQITQVQTGSAADRAGIQIGDVVLSMDGEAIRNFDGLTEFVGRHGPGDEIEVEIERAVAGRVPQRLTRTVTLDGWD